MSEERWLPVPGFEGYYEVSDLGNVRSIPRYKCPGCTLKPRPLPRSGYMQVSFSVNGVIAMQYVHRLVAAAFIGPCPAGQEVLHDDDNPANNALDNLKYGTHRKNQADMAERGRSSLGELHGASVLTNQDAAAIRWLWERGERITDLAIRFRASKPVISRIISNHAYPDESWSPRRMCTYPGCDQPAQPGGGRGRLPLYCEDPDHNRISAKTARARLARV